MSINKKAIKLFQQGNQKLQSKDLYGALTDYKKAVKIAPAFPEPYYNIGVIGYQLGMLETAEKALKKHIMLRNNSSAGHYLYAVLLYRVGKTNAALSSYKRAYKLDNNNVEAAAGVAVIHNYNKEYQLAYESIKAIISNKKASVSIAQIFSKICSKLDKCDEALEYLKHITAPTSALDNTSKNTVNFYIGDIYDKQGFYDEAFSSYKIANESQPFIYDSATYDQLGEKIKATYSKEDTENYVTSEIDSTKPVFIIGMPRSGTSLIEQILSSHSQIFGVGESNEIRNIANSVSNGRENTYPQCIQYLSSETLREYALGYLKNHEKLTSGEPIIIDKMPHNFFHLGLISQLFPKCRIIHCVRHPLDTCLSIYFQNFNETHRYAGNLKSLAHHYSFYTRLMRHWKNVLPIDIIDISYEDTVSDMRGVTSQLLSYLNLEWEEQCMTFYKSKRHVITASQEQVDKPIYQSSSGRWKNYEIHLDPLIKELEAHDVL